MIGTHWEDLEHTKFKDTCLLPFCPPAVSTIRPSTTTLASAAAATAATNADHKTTNKDEAIWQTWTLVIDPGTQADIAGHFRNRVVGGIITACGVVAAAILVAFVVDVVKCQLETFR